MDERALVMREKWFPIELRYSNSFVSWKEHKAVVADLKTFYATVRLQQAEPTIDKFTETRDRQHSQQSNLGTKTYSQ